MARSPLISLTAEFLGTFLLVFTVGCNVLSGNTNWGGVSIACVLMVSVYALGDVSGANFNPAVSIALACANKMSWCQALSYCAVQVGGALAAAGSYTLLFHDTFNLGPTKGFHWAQAMTCEMLYTFMLCFVVLNTAASKKLGGRRYQWYGLAIGLVIVAGAYGPGAVSGGCFNPAVAIGIDVVSAQLGFGWCILYSAFEIIGGVLAVVAFEVMRPEERNIGDPPTEYSLFSKILGEAIGTYMLVLTVGLNVLGASPAAAFSIAACLTSMIYAIGDVSGAHFNPAVTLAIMGSGRGKISMPHAGIYMITQVIAGIAGAFTYQLVHDGTTFGLGPGEGFSWKGVAVAELMYTFVLCLVVLSVATTEKNPSLQFTGFIIGMCVTVGGLAIGKISGGSLNPAVSMGIATSRKVVGNGTFSPGLTYSALEFFAGLFASVIFRILHQKEYPDEFDVEKA